jgi:hypothetical protein
VAENVSLVATDQGRERGTGHRAAEPAHRAGSRPAGILP